MRRRGAYPAAMELDAGACHTGAGKRRRLRALTYREAGASRLREIKEVGRAVAETDAWIDDLAQRLGWHDRGKTYAALIGALHGLRDALPRDEVVHLGAQLAPLLRGFYYEGWRDTFSERSCVLAVWSGERHTYEFSGKQDCAVMVFDGALKKYAVIQLKDVCA